MYNRNRSNTHWIVGAIAVLVAVMLLCGLTGIIGYNYVDHASAEQQQVTEGQQVTEEQLTQQQADQEVIFPEVREDCSYDPVPLNVVVVDSDDTGDNSRGEYHSDSDGSVLWTVEVGSDEVLIGDAMFVSVDGVPKTGPILFGYSEPGVYQLTMKDGAYFVIKRVYATDFIGLRMRHLKCRFPAETWMDTAIWYK